MKIKSLFSATALSAFAALAIAATPAAAAPAAASATAPGKANTHKVMKRHPRKTTTQMAPKIK